MIDINALSDAEKVQLARDLEDAKARDAVRVQAEQNAAAQQKRLSGRLERVVGRLRELEPWADQLRTWRTETEQKLAALDATRAPEHDRFAWSLEERTRAELNDTIAEIDHGLSAASSGNLRVLMQQANLQPLAGRPTIYADRYSLPHTEREIAELTAERERLKAELTK